MNAIISHLPSATYRTRRVAVRTSGIRHGKVTRLMSPADLGQMLKPFVFLDMFDVDFHDAQVKFPIHPHSGLATITVITEGNLRFDDAADGTGYIGFGGFEWMRAGNGVWHGQELSAGTTPRAKGFQLWIALAPELEHESVDSQYVEAASVPTAGPAHVILGRYEGARSPARAPQGVTYLLVRLAAGMEWTFTPPSVESLAWIAVANGSLAGETQVKTGEMVIFEESNEPISLRASFESDAVFVIGSARPHPHELYLGRYSVHTSSDSLATGEANIARLRKFLVASGDRRGPGDSIPIFSN